MGVPWDARPVSYTHLDVYKRQRKDRDCEELNEFLMNTPFSSNTIEDEKICMFQNKKQEEKKRKNAAIAKQYRQNRRVCSLCTLYVSKA